MKNTTNKATATEATATETVEPTAGPRKITLTAKAMPIVKKDDIVVEIPLDVPQQCLISLGEGQVRNIAEATITSVVYRKVFRASIQKNTLGSPIDQVLVDVKGKRKGSTTEEILFEAKLAWGQDFDIRRGRSNNDVVKEDTLVVQTVGRHWTRLPSKYESANGPRVRWNIDENSVSVKELISGYVVTHEELGSPEFSEIVEAIKQNRTSDEVRHAERLAKEQADNAKLGAAGASGAFSFSGNA